MKENREPKTKFSAPPPFSLKIRKSHYVLYIYIQMIDDYIIHKNNPLNVNKVNKHGVLRKLKHIFPNTYQRIKSICSPAKGGTGCYRFNYQPGS